jgi:diketogulonate reductase-like aldo/keto reductase
MEAWNTMSSFVPEKVRSLGISNTTLPALQAICSRAQVKPSIVQNRFHARTGYDVQLRKYCQDNGIAYEAFWTLTANPQLVSSALVGEVASTVGVAREVALYALIRSLSIYVLNGTTQEARMRSDIDDFKKIHLWRCAKANKEQWTAWMLSFKQILDGANPAGT